MDENKTVQEGETNEEVSGEDNRPSEAQKEQTEAENKAEAEAQHKAEDEARKQRLTQAELDIHTLYNYAVQSPNFMGNSKHCLSSYIRLIALIELLGGVPVTNRENVDMAKENLKNAAAA